MGRRGRVEINKAEDSTTDTEDERGVAMQCTEDCHYKCSECGVQKTGSHNWKQVDNEWICEMCWMVKGMKDWDPWMKMVPDTPSHSATAQSSTWVPPVPNTHVDATEIPVPNYTHLDAIEIPVPNDEDTIDVEMQVDDQGQDEQPPNSQELGHKP